MYNDHGTTNQAVLNDSFNITNAYINYTIRLSINSVFQEHNIVGVVPAATTSSLPAGGDQLTLLPGRSIMISLTVGVSPKNG
jgi:iron complex outermembrane receptor protein